MATLTQNTPLTLELSGVSKAEFSFASITATPYYSYAAGGSVQWSTVQTCAWCGTAAGEWNLSYYKSGSSLTIDFGKVMEKVYVTFYPTYGTSTMTLVNDATEMPAPVPVPAAGALLGTAMLGAVIWKKLATRKA
ncbi:hypothetical protein H4P12_07345 [Paracoccus sp. 11-3]|uniref:Uncharacterized protein n=1 Tax=Paracoccus amoyensis TaxID=2760093 RepID=A0A926GFR5_9RHOB|nr:hypothetical protein [Paracoccus amoyensis]MBC9246529.1 hypothetical protein [Paracoccus amoyensis]